MFMYDIAAVGTDCGYFPKHSYTVVALKDGKTVASKTYMSRGAAAEYMYNFIDKHNLYMKKIWDDKHDKTYFCNNDYEFHINRDC